ncbi:MAG TPA: glycosyltransferase 87 family protein [Gaiellaceae bacterium]|nr:glycosyltransferase 87 family protein [Gaiellaceae bacterium]
MLAGAAALRLVGVRYGLPFGGLLNPDELNVVPRAWRMTHGGGADPHWFDWPTLVLYLQVPFQAWAGAPAYLVARILTVGLGVAGVAAAWWAGRLAYGVPAGLVAAAATAVETTHVAYSRAAVTDVPTTLGITLAIGLALAGRFEWAGAAAGLATAAKYPGVFALVPLAVLAWGRWRRLATSLGVAAVAFFVGTPFVLLDFGHAWRDLRRVEGYHTTGWLGFEHDPPGPLAVLDRLWHGYGPFLAFALAGLAVALRRRTRVDLALAAFVLSYFVFVSLLHSHFDRYTLPLVPVLAVLASRARPLVPVAVVSLAVPLWWSAAKAATLTRTDTRVVAQRWIEAHLPHGATVAAESSTPPLPGFRVTPLALPGRGRPHDPNRSLAHLRATGIRYVLVTGAVADRVLRARDDYPYESRFYDDLAARARLVYRLDPGGGLSGPWVRVYHVRP